MNALTLFKDIANDINSTSLADDLEIISSKDSGNEYSENEKKLIFFQAVFHTLGKLSISHSHESMSEDVFFLNSTISEMELDKKRIKAANKLFQKGLESLGNFIDDGYLDMFRDATEEEADQGNYNRRIMFVSLMAEYLINNEEISEYKLSSLFEIAEYFDFDDSIVKQLLHPTQEDLEHYYDVLDCSADANLDEVKKSFRQKSKEFHPDSRSKDMDTAENEEADRKFRELSEAWNKIKAYHYEIDN